MLILTIRTDKPQAEVGIYKDNERLLYEKWQAHRELAETIHKKLEEILNKLSKPLDDVQGIVFYKGPGSFTGLRIGLSVANSLAYSLDIPIIGTTSEDWISLGIKDLHDGKKDKIVKPEYGAPVRITTPKK